MPADCLLRPRRELAMRRFALAPGADLRCGVLAKDRAGDDIIDLPSDDYAAVWLLRGGGVYRDAQVGVVRLSPGDLVQRLPGRRHSTIGDADGRWVEIFVSFPGGLFSSLAAVGALVAEDPVLHPGLDGRLVREGERLLAALQGADETAYPGLLAQALALVVALHDRHRRHGGGRSDGSAEAVETACRLLGEDPARPLHPRQVAQAVGLGYERFRKLFRHRVGLSPAAYRRRRRLDAARAELLGCRRSVTEVASRLGWPDVFAFTREFTREVGLPPGRWRRGH